MDDSSLQIKRDSSIKRPTWGLLIFETREAAQTQGEVHTFADAATVAALLLLSLVPCLPQRAVAAVPPVDGAKGQSVVLLGFVQASSVLEVLELNLSVLPNQKHVEPRIPMLGARLEKARYRRRRQKKQKGSAWHD